MTGGNVWRSMKRGHLSPAPLFALNGRSTVAAVLRRSAEWVHEAPGLVRGLAELAWPLRWNFAIVLGFNVVIAVWETIQPFILAWGVDTFEARVPYLEIVAIIVFPVLAIGLPHGIRAAASRAISMPPGSSNRSTKNASACSASSATSRRRASTHRGGRSARRRRSPRKGASPPTS